MNWTDDAILLSVSKVAAKALLVDVLTRDHGRCRALVSLSKVKLPTLLPGCFIRLAFNPGASGQIGIAELRDISGGLIADSEDNVGLAVLEAIKDLAISCLPEREPFRELYGVTTDLMHSLLAEDARWPLHFVKWEFYLALDLDYILDYERCLPDFRHGETVYLSPRSGRLVTRLEAGAFLDRMLPVPRFLMGARNANIAEIRLGDRLTRKVFERFVLPDAGLDATPATRESVARRFSTMEHIPVAQSAFPPLIDEEARVLRMESGRPLMVARKAIVG